MKMLFAGNLGNFGYIMAHELRKRGIEATLLLDKDPHITSNPKYLDHDIQVNGYPEWFVFYDLKGGWKKQVLKTMRQKDYDLIHAYTELPIFAMISRKLYVAQPTGDDLRELAFEKSLKGILLKRAYHSAKINIYTWPPHRYFLNKLRISRIVFAPLAWTYELPEPKEVRDDDLNSEKFIIFHPTVQDWKMKGNDTFLRAFVKLCKERDDFLLIYIDWGVDSQKARSLLDLPFVRNKVKVLPGPINRKEMAYYISHANVVVDQFVSGSYNRMALEAFALSKPVIASFDAELHKDLYGEAPPVFATNSEDELYNGLKILIDSKDLPKELGKRSRDWVIKYHNMDRCIDKFMGVYKAVIDNEDISNLQYTINQI